MHPTTGAYWISKHKFTKRRLLSPQPRAQVYTAISYTSKIHSFASSKVTLALSLCLSQCRIWRIQEAEDKHEYQVPPRTNDSLAVGREKPRLSNIRFYGGYQSYTTCIIVFKKISFYRFYLVVISFFCS